MHIPLSSRGVSTRRTVQGMLDDNERFIKAGGDIKNAKEYNNCISKPFFSITISQVLWIYIITKATYILHTTNIRCACQRLHITRGFFKRYLHSLKRLAIGLTLCWHLITNLNGRALTMSMQQQYKS